MYSASDNFGFPNTDKMTDFSALITFAFPVSYNVGTESHPANPCAAVIGEHVICAF